MKFDIIGWCEDNINRVKLNSTKQLVGECPWCGKYGKFYVDSENGHYICFACEEKGKFLVGLMAHIEGISHAEARQYILRNSVEFRRKETTTSLVDKIEALGAIDEDEKVLCPLPPEFIPIWKDGKWSCPVYLLERNIRKNTAREWELGWARHGRYAGRVIVPVICPNGRSFTARDVTGEQDPRYMNPVGVDHARLLLGWNKHNEDGDVILVEGPFDAIMMWQHGLPALALMGKVLHAEQFAILARKPPETHITIMLDPEEIEAPYKVAEMLSCRFRDVSIAKLPIGVDPGSSTRQQAVNAIDGSVPYVGNSVNKLMEMIDGSKRKLSNFYS